MICITDEENDMTETDNHQDKKNNSLQHLQRQMPKILEKVNTWDELAL